MTSLSKIISAFGIIGSCYAYALYGIIQGRGTLVSAKNVEAPISDVVEGCNLWYTTDASDTCESIMEASGITVEKHIKWNPSLEDGVCNNLILPDTDYCVGLEPERSPKPSKTTPLQNSETTPPPSTKNTIATPAPIQLGMTASCNQFHYVRMGQGCIDILPEYPGLTLELLYKWNPAIGKKCNTMWADTYICVGTFEDTPAESPRDLEPIVIATTPPPTTTSTTTAIKGTPSPISAGTTRNCMRWAYVRAGDSCQSILSRNKSVKSSVADIFRWNHSIRLDCTNLIAGNYICIVGPALIRPPTPTTTRVITTMMTTTMRTTTVRRPTTTRAAAVADDTPSPVQPGTVLGCLKWAYVKDGQTCNDIIAKFPGLTLKDLVTWNPAIGTECSTMWARTYVCVMA